MLKLKAQKAFMLNSKLYKQVDGCSIGGTFAVIFYDIYMTKPERKVTN